MKITRISKKNYKETVLVDSEVSSTSTDGMRISLAVWGEGYTYNVQFTKADVVKMLDQINTEVAE